MKKEQILSAICDLKKHFSDKDIALMLSQLLKCKSCPFKVSCNSMDVKTCKEYFLRLLKYVKGVK